MKISQHTVYYSPFHLSCLVLSMIPNQYCIDLVMNLFPFMYIGTGVIASVPSVDPADYAALIELKRKEVCNMHVHTVGDTNTIVYLLL